MTYIIFTVQIRQVRSDWMVAVENNAYANPIQLERALDEWARSRILNQNAQTFFELVKATERPDFMSERVWGWDYEWEDYKIHVIRMPLHGFPEMKNAEA